MSYHCKKCGNQLVGYEDCCYWCGLTKKIERLEKALKEDLLHFKWCRSGESGMYFPDFVVEYMDSKIVEIEEILK